MPPDPIDTGGDNSIFSSLLNMFVGADFRAAMKSIISLGVGDALRMNVGDTPFGPAAVWDQQNVGRNMFDHFMQQTTGSIMQSTAQARELGRYDLSRSLAMRMGMDPDAMNPLGMTATSFFASQLYNQLGTQQLERGLGLASQYMGAMPINLAQDRQDQMALRDQLSAMNQRVMSNFVKHFERYGGMSGAGVGRIIAEGARLGMFTRDTDPNEVIAFAQRTAQAVGTAQQFFQGSATEVMDQLNATMGVNAVATFGGAGTGGSQLNRMLTQMSAAGMVTGLSDQQMRMLTIGAANVSMAQGNTPMGAMANARDAAILTTAANRSGVSAFVNEASLRQSIVNQVVRTQESDASRAVYGAYAMLESRAPGSGQAFLDKVQGKSDLSLSSVLNMVSDELGGVSAGDLIDAGYSQAAEQARAGGQATMAMVRSRLGSIQEDRAAYLGQLGLNVSQFGGDLSVQNIERVLKETDNVAMAGQIRRVFAGQARQYGYSSAENMDAALRSATLASQMGGAMSNVERMQLQIQGFGRVRGAMGFINLVNKLGTGEGQNLTVRSVLESLMGAGGADIQAAIGANAGIFNVKEMQALLAGDADLTLGLDVAVQALQTGQIGGRRLGEAEMDELTEAFTTEDKTRRTELFQKFAGMADPSKRLAFASERHTTSFLALQGKIYSKDELAKMSDDERKKAYSEMAKNRREYADEGKLMAQLEEYERLSKSETDVLMSGGRAGEFGGTAALYRSFLEQTSGDAEEARSMLKTEIGASKYKAFMTNFEENTKVQESMGGKSGGMAEIIALIRRVLNEGIKTQTEPNPENKGKDGGGK